MIDNEYQEKLIEALDRNLELMKECKEQIEDINKIVKALNSKK